MGKQTQTLMLGENIGTTFIMRDLSTSNTVVSVFMFEPAFQLLGICPENIYMYI